MDAFLKACIATVAFQRHAFLAVFTLVCALISLAGYCWDGSIPVLMVGPDVASETENLSQRGGGSLTPTLCSPRCGNETSSDNTVLNHTTSGGASLSPFMAFGPSKVEDVIPMHVLVKKVSMNERKGLSYLDHISLSRYYQCQPARILFLDQELASKNERRCTELTFQTRDHPIVALVSFHGSGNTWVRHLLEQATGVYSGSIYCDPSLKLTFPGEGITGGSVIAVKTHQPDALRLPKAVQMSTGKERYDKAILLVRDPFDALVSEANRRWNAKRLVGSHVGLADEIDFLSSKWDWYVEYKGMTWSFLLHTWLSQHQAPVHVVQYERLVSDLRGELVKMLEFLDLAVSEETLDCAVRNGHGKFERTKHLNFDPFTADNRALVNRIIRQATPLLARYGIKYNTR